MLIQVITLFPEMFTGVLGSSMLYKASNKGIVSYSLINLRNYGKGLRHQVDDTPYGGGDGMLFMVEPMVKAVEFAKKQDPEAIVILPTPRGSVFTQTDANELSKAGKGLIIICPRYEGYDERITNWVEKQFSVGRYVLTGGEIPAMIIVDSVVRLLPGVLGGENSAAKESFQDSDRPEYPQYTRPEVYRGQTVPPELLSGNHALIERWRENNR